MGYIGVDIVDKIKIWTEQDITLLFLLSKIVGVSVAASVKLRESKQQKKALISNYNSILKVLGSLYYDIPIGIELYDSRGLLVDINNTDMKIFGIVDKEGILGLSIFENPLISDKEKQALRKGKSLELIIDYDFDKVHDYYKSTYSEDVKFITSYISPVKSDDGDIIYYLNFVNDITRIREMQQELIAAKEKAEESDRIKSAFLANMSHEIRTPLNAIVGFSSLLVVDHTESEKQDYIKLITSNSEILLNLINDILDLSKIEAGVINFYNTYFDLNDLFDELYSYFSMKVRKDVTLIAVKPKKSMKVLFDKKRLFQILSNFISNSVKFTMKGQIKFGYKIENNGLKVYVEDTGIGISDGQKDKIFKRFEKIESFSQGTGIGLSIVKALIDKANGVIEFSSEYGQGSTFWVWLPIEKIIDDDF